jgi:hypothetical protein
VDGTQWAGARCRRDMDDNERTAVLIQRNRALLALADAARAAAREAVLAARRGLHMVERNRAERERRRTTVHRAADA